MKVNTTSNGKPKVLYLYAGLRGDFYKKWKQGLNPDTQLLGLNYMREFGIDAEFKEYFISRLLRKINYNLMHLPYIFILKKYDIIFICSGLLLVFLAKHILRMSKPKFVIYNTYLSNAIKRNQKGIRSYITRKAIENIDAIVCTSIKQKEHLENAGYNSKKIIFRPIGIDATKFAEASRKFQVVEKYIASAGRDLGRDYKTLFEAVKDLDISVKVATKKETVAGLTIPKNVELILDLPYEVIPEFYAKSLFAIVPLKEYKNINGSDTSGQYGYLEPMATGKAVIVSDRDTVRDYIDDNVNGLLVKSDDSQNLRSVVEKLINDPVLAKHLGDNAKEKVFKEYTSKKFAFELSLIFKRISA